MSSILTIFLFFISFSSVAAQQIKLAVLVPEGTTWGKSLKNFSRDVQKLTGGDVKVRVYFGGVSGDEPDVLRKIRIGQLHGGIFTGKTLGEIHSDIRALEIPFTFYNDHKKASATVKNLAPGFNQELEKKGFVNLGFFEIGMVYVVSSKKIANLNELKGVKIWSWEGDPLVGALLDTLKLVSVPLALPDVLSSLSTGIIDSAYAPPLGILALQWHTKIKYLVDFPTAFSVGALLVSKKAWAKINKDYQEKILMLAQKYISEANEKSLIESQAAKEELKKSGVEFVSFPEEDYKKAASVRSKVIETLKGKHLSSQIIQEIDKQAKK